MRRETLAVLAVVGAVRCSPGETVFDSGSPEGGTIDSGPPSRHRPTAGSCSTALRPPGDVDLDAGALVPTPYDPDGGVVPQCHNDGECDAGLNGRCQWTAQQFGPPYQIPLCSYDQCLSDQDCANGGVCDCRGATVYGLGPANQCLPANCRVDSDCASGFCSPTPLNGCNAGFYCHVLGDSCRNDSDCANGQQCAFFNAATWRCMGPCSDGGT